MRVQQHGLKICRFTAICTLVMTFCGLSGCSGKEKIDRTAVTGTVTIDGSPVPEGAIQFIPFPGVKGPPVQIAIVDGKFTANSATGPAVGKNTVQITAMKKTGKKTKTIMGDEAEEIIQYIPPKYNELTELSADVKSGGEPLKFELIGK